MLQDNVMHLQIAADRLSVYQRKGTDRICVVVLRTVPLAILQQLDCGRGLDTGVVALAVA